MILKFHYFHLQRNKEMVELRINIRNKINVRYYTYCIYILILYILIYVVLLKV